MQGRPINVTGTTLGDGSPAIGRQLTPRVLIATPEGGELRAEVPHDRAGVRVAHPLVLSKGAGR